MARNAKLDRLLTLVKALGESAEGLTLDEMAEVIGANRRTAERLRDLILVHFDLEESGMHGRKLELEYANGSKAIVLLDQGFGYWRIAGNLPRYDFNAAPAVQASALFGLSATVSGTGESYFAVTKK